jgi:hypothetical protein
MTKEEETKEFETGRELMEKIKIKDIENEISDSPRMVELKVKNSARL